VESTFSDFSKKRIGGVVVMETPTLISLGKEIGAAASRHRVAAIGFREVAEGGGLLAYGADIAQMWRQAATYVDKILKGQKPGDLPVERASNYELVINKNAAAMLGIKIPDAILLRATQLIS
jgi:putative ABC transport system substrate-binding protein